MAPRKERFTLVSGTSYPLLLLLLLLLLLVTLSSPCWRCPTTEVGVGG
jgi:hypothetical protein